MSELRIFANLIDSRNGDTYDISEIISNLTITSKIDLTPGTCTFTIPDATKLDFQPGAIVSITINGNPMFRGAIFSKSRTRHIKEIAIKCYDYVRYLQNKSWMKVENKSCTQVFTDICTKLNIQNASVSRSSSFIPESKIYDNKTYLEILKDLVKRELAYNHQIYFIRQIDNKFQFMNSADCVLQREIGDNAGVCDLRYETAIDKGVYNQVVLYRDCEDGVRRDTVVEDSELMKQQGLLRLYQKYDTNSISPEQAKNRAEEALRAYKHANRKLSLTCIGQEDVFAGSYIRVKLALGDINLDQYCLITSCTHKIDGSVHSMELVLDFRLQSEA